MMFRLACICITLVSYSTLSFSQPDTTTYQAKEVLLLMGTRFEFGAYASSQSAAEKAVLEGIAEVERIEALISSWQSTSETSRINRAAGKPVAVSEELYRLIERAQKVASLTQGAFDLTAAGMHRIYKFEKQDTSLPSAEIIDKSKESVDYKNIVLIPDSFAIQLKNPSTKIGFGAIGKGYAANRALQRMRSSNSVSGAVVNAAGDLACSGSGAEGNPWTVTISDPRDPSKWLGQISITTGAVVTSGDYEKYFFSNGKRYAHIIDPRSGLPTTEVQSTTIVCPDAELADALATSLFVLGPSLGIQLLNQLRNIEGLLVDADGKIHTSKGLVLQPYQP